MHSRGLTLCAVLLALFTGLAVTAQTGLRRMDMKSRVLDIAFRSGFTLEPYIAKLVLRFGDTDTQLVVTLYPALSTRPGGSTVITRYSFEGLGDGGLPKLISRMIAENPNVTDREIASRLKVKITQSAMKYDLLHRFLQELMDIRISPVIEGRAALDAYSEFEFWYDTGQESVHYSLAGPFDTDPQDRLVQWMLRFRAATAKLAQHPTETGVTEPRK